MTKTFNESIYQHQPVIAYLPVKKFYRNIGAKIHCLFNFEILLALPSDFQMPLMAFFERRLLIFVQRYFLLFTILLKNLANNKLSCFFVKQKQVWNIL